MSVRAFQHGYRFGLNSLFTTVAILRPIFWYLWLLVSLFEIILEIRQALFIVEFPKKWSISFKDRVPQLADNRSNLKSPNPADYD